MSDDAALREKVRALLSRGLRTRVEPIPMDNAVVRPAAAWVAGRARLLVRLWRV